MLQYFRFSSLVFVFLFFGGSVYAQNEKVTQVTLDGDTIVLEAIALTKVTSSLEADYAKIQKLSESREQEENILKFDSIFQEKSAFLNEQVKIIESKKEEFSERDLSNSISEWKSYERKVGEWKDHLNSNISTIEEIIYDIRTMKTVWDLTNTEIKKTEAPESVLKNVTDMIDTISAEIKKTVDIQNDLLKKETDITELIFLIKNNLAFLEELEKKLQSNYFVQDSPPIWAAGDSSISYSYIQTYVKKAVQENRRSWDIFQETNRQLIYLHIFLFFLIWIAFFFLKKQSVTLNEDEAHKETDLIQAHSAISNHLIPTIIISVFLSLWIYPVINSTLGSIMQFIYLVVGILFLPKYIDKQLKPILYSITLLFIISQVQLYFPSQMLFYRLVLLAKAGFAGWIVYKILAKDGILRKKLILNKIGIVLPIVYLFYLFLIVSILGNIWGNLNLSILLCNTVVNALVGLIIVLLVIITLNRTSIILLRSKFFRKSAIVNNHWQIIEKRVTQIIFIGAFFLWIRSILRSLNIYDQLIEWFSSLTQMSWKVGNSNIELGGILAFLLVIFLMVVIYRVVNILLVEEFFPRIKLPRGVPGAISMIVGYVIVAYGIYLALAAAGVDLGQFGLMAGALGVGIGFGLQNIVANFIAGLILAFERPIEVGDTIESGTVMGDVKAIGVRACTIRTFDGSEVMVPNGNMIANDVINWTLSDRKKRYDIFVSVAYRSNPHEVMALIKKVAEEHPNVLKIPAPWALFDGFGDSALNFRIRIWTTLDVGLTTKSEVAINIFDALADAGIEIPFPQRDLHLRSFDSEVAEVLETKKKS